MDTIVKKIDRAHVNQADLSEAVRLLREGELVAFPTETVYGLGGDALDETAAHKIYTAKGRPSDNPLIVHIAEISALKELCVEVPEVAFLLAEKFWPGPMTMILKKSSIVPYGTTGGLDTVAVRMPSDLIAHRLIKESGIYIAAPSANLSGRPSPTTADHVIEDMSGRIPMILDGGAVPIGLESTIIDLTIDPPLILRPGFITKEDLDKVIKEIEYDPAVISKHKNERVVAKAPGMKYRHYAPKGSLTIFEGATERVVMAINKEAEKMKAQGIKVGIIATEETKEKYPYGTVMVIGSRKDERSIAAHLFGMLREFDSLKIPVIYSESFEDNHLSQAIMNRLLKAAGYQMIHCD